MKALLSHITIAFVLALTTVVMLAAPASAQPTAIFVDDDFPGDSPAEHLWTTITKGIADATPGAGDTIYVGPGTYYESIVVNVSNLTLQGYSSSEVTVDGQGAQYTVRVSAEDVSLRQLRIIGGSIAGVRWESVQKGYLESNVVTGNYYGIWIASLLNQTIQCNEIYGNSQDGIYVTNSTMKDVSSNNIYSNGRHGITLLNSS
ncbi:MAG: right-handed parallel beta-helix repeat-containing protein, partial [Dehalococcoidia bacterium]